MADQRTLSGVVTFAQPIGPGEGILRVLVEDVSRADAAATVVASAELPIERAVPAGGRLPFRLSVPVADESRRYGVRVHVDQSGDGAVTEGDRISTVSHPVLTQGAGDEAEVTVTAV